ncbi:MAG: hypothetical protein ACRCSP_10285 [Rhodoglobus sp.]
MKNAAFFSLAVATLVTLLVLFDGETGKGAKNFLVIALALTSALVFAILHQRGER